MRVLENLFDSGKVLRSTSFISGNLISTFPLDLLTNQAVQNRFYKEKTDYNMLCFGDHQNLRAAELIEKKRARNFQKKYIGRIDLFRLWWNRNDIALSLGSIRGSILTTYMESHDNLVIELY